MLRSTGKLIVISIVCLAAVLVFHGRALAHGHIDVGEYSLVIGFHNEPAIVGEPNAVSIAVTHHAEEESHEEEATAEPTEEAHEEGEEEHEEGDDHAAAEPVSGLEESLRVEIIKGSETRELELRPLFGAPGTYVADVLPTETGDYTFHIFGDINGTPVDETMTSGPDTFSSVGGKDALAFPATEPSAAALQQQAQTALYAGIAGAVLGLIGLVTGVLALRKAGSTR